MCRWVACLLLLACSRGAEDDVEQPVTATQVDERRSVARGPLKHVAVIAFEQELSPLLDESRQATLVEQSWPTEEQILTCALARGAGGVWVSLHNAGVINANSSHFVYPAGEPLESLRVVQNWCRLADRYSSVDCGVQRGSLDSVLWQGWDIKCLDGSSSEPELGSRDQRTAQLERATAACRDAEAVLAACAESVPATAAIGAQAARAIVASAQSFHGSGYGLVVHGIDSDQELFLDFAVNIGSESEAAQP